MPLKRLLILHALSWLLAGVLFAEASGADESLHTIGARAFNDRAYQFALSRFKKIIDDFPSSSFRASAFYHAGLCQYYLGEGENADFFFNQLARDYPLDPFTAKSRYYLCKALLDRGQKSAALDEARTSLAKYKLGDEEGRLRVLIGKIYAESGQEDLALKEWKAVPGPEARFETGLYFLSKGKNAEAEKIFTALAESLPPSSDATLLEKVSFQRLKSIFYSGKLDEALSLLDSFLARFPSGLYSEEARFLKAYLPYEKKDFQTAANGLGELIASSNAPSFYPTALYYLARSLEECGQDILAQEKYLEIIRAKTAKETKPNEGKFYIEALRQSLRLYSRKGDEAHAREMLGLLASAGKGEGAEGALRELADFYIEKDPAKAALYYQELVKTSRKSAYYRGLAYALIKSDRAAEAEAVLSEAVNVSSQTNEKVELLFVLAENFLEAGKWEQAEKSFQRILDLGSPTRRDEAREGLAYSFFQRKMVDKARSLYAELRGSSDAKIRAAAFYFLGECDRLAGKVADSIAGYRAFLENFPDDTRRSTAQLRLGKLYYDAKDYARAYATFEKIAESEDPNKVQAQYWLGWCLVQQKDNRQAIDAFLALRKIDTSLATTYAADGILTAAKLLTSERRASEARQVLLALAVDLRNAAIRDTKLQRFQREALYQILAGFLDDKNFNQAEFYGKALAESAPGENILVSAFGALADAFYEAKRFDKSSDYYGRALEIEKSREIRNRLLFWKGLSDKQRSAPEEANKAFSELLKEGPESNEWYWQGLYESGVLLNQMGKMEDSRKQLDEVRLKAPDAALRKKAESILNEGSKRSEVAEVNAENDPAKIAEMVRRFSDAEAKALAFYKLGSECRARDPQKALDYFRQAAGASSGETGAKSQFQIVKLLFENKNDTSAFQEGMTLLYTFGETGVLKEELYFMLGTSAWRTGQKNDAKRFFELLKNGFPGSLFLKKIPDGAL